MRERFPGFFDRLVWLAVICGDAGLLLTMVACSLLVVQKLGGSYTSLALVGATGGLCYMLSCPLGGRYGPRIGLRRMALIGAALYVTGTLLMTRFDSLPLIALAAGVNGLAGGFVWPNLEMEMSRGRERSRLRRRLSIFNTMWCTGTLIGPLLGSFIYPDKAVIDSEGGRAAINHVFYVAATLSCGLLIFLALWRDAGPGKPQAETPDLDEAPHDPARLRAFLWMAYVANFSCYIVLAVLRQLYEKLADQQWAGDEAARNVFLLLVGLAAASALMFLAMFFLHRWAYRLKRHLLSQVATMAALLLVALTGNFFWALVGFVVIGISTSFIYSGSLFYSIEGKDESSHMAGWHEAVLGFGSMSGLVVSGTFPALLAGLGVTSDHWLIRSPYLFATGLFGLGILAQLLIYRHYAPRFTER